MLSTIEKKFILGAAGILSILILIGLISLGSLQTLVTQSQEVTRIRMSIDALEETISQMKDVETGTRGYLLSANPQFLEPYHSARQQVLEEENKLDELLFSPINKTVHLPKLKSLIRQKLSFTQIIIQNESSHPGQDPSEKLLLQEGKDLMDQIRLLVNRMKEEEMKALLLSEQEQTEMVDTTRAVIISSSILAMLIVFVALFLLRKDITRRKQAEEKLCQSAKMLKEAQQIAKLGHWEYNLNSRELIISDALYNILGIPHQSTTFRSVDHFYQLLTPQETQRLQQELEQSILTGNPYQTEYQICLPDGEKRYIFNQVQPQMGADGKVSIVRGTSQDITERKLAEEALRRSEARFSSIFRLNPLPSGITRFTDGKVLEVNDKALAVFGFTREESHDVTTMQLKLWPNPAMRYDLLEQLKQKSILQFENSYRNKEGNLWNAITSMEVIELDGEKCILTIIQDITERKRNEEAMKAYSEQMEQLNAAKDKFFSIIAHDLMSPVNGLIGAADLLTHQINGMNPKEISQFSQAILVSANNLKRFLSNLLEWAQTQSNQMAFKPKQVHLKMLALDVVSLLKDPIQSKSIHLKVDIPEHCQVEADENMIHSVLRNLLSNAIKFSRIGGDISITGEVLTDQIQITISDTGVGMSKTVQEKLFRIDSKHTTLGTAGERGTGLGLLLCKEFVEKHRGEIWVESQEGKGTNFSFKLPFQPLMAAHSAS